MAIHNPPDLYTFGAVNINRQPSVNMYAQLMARKRAKEDALDQYYSKVLSDVTDAGMRNKDVLEGWSQKVNNWQTKYMNPEKRKFLLNPRLDDYKTITAFNQEHQDIIQDANKSKAEAKDEALISQHKFSGKWNPTDEDLIIAHRKGLSIYNPARKDELGKDPGISDFSFNVPEFTPLQEKQAYQAATVNVPKDEHYDEKRIRKDGFGTLYVPKITGYTDPTKVEAIMDNYSNNMTKAQLVKYENLMHNQESYNAATKAYQQFKGGDAVIGTAREMGAGMAAISVMADISEKEQKAPDWMLRVAVADTNTMKHIAYSWGLRMQVGENLQAIINNAYNADFEYAKDHNGEVPTNKEKLKILTGVASGHLKMDAKTGDYQVWGMDANGNDILKQTIPANEAKSYMLKYQAPSIKPGVVPGSKLPQGRLYRVNGYDYTEQDVINAATQLGLSKEAYMKKYNIK